eukprot:m.137050 g.137050  ORF g.137050 m.137050 type:complete len:214 (+) comp38208_c1_seq1:19-660(+)
MIVLRCLVVLLISGQNAFNCLQFGFHITEEGDCSLKVELDDKITVYYEVFHENGTKIIATSSKPSPTSNSAETALTYVVGSATTETFKELWNEAVLGMCLGETRKITVISGKSEKDWPRSTLLRYHVRVKNIQKKKESQSALPPLSPGNFKKMDSDGNGSMTKEEFGVYARHIYPIKDQQILTKLVNTFFTYYDRNKDKVITEAELFGRHTEL